MCDNVTVTALHHYFNLLVHHGYNQQLVFVYHLVHPNYWSWQYNDYQFQKTVLYAYRALSISTCRMTRLLCYWSRKTRRHARCSRHQAADASVVPRISNMPYQRSEVLGRCAQVHFPGAEKHLTPFCATASQFQTITLTQEFRLSAARVDVDIV